jgi:hypothetical protein
LGEGTSNDILNSLARRIEASESTDAVSLGPHGLWFWKGVIDGRSLTAYNLTPDKFTDDVRYEVSVNGRSLQWVSMSSGSGIAVFKDGVCFLEKVLISVAD